MTRPDPITKPLYLGPHLVPGLWRFMLPDDLGYMQFPKECQSTCAACPKIKDEGFHPDYRCCTYQPRVPNVLLGFTLEDPETAALAERAIAEGATTPEGMIQSPLQTRVALAHGASGAFGKDTTVACRFLDPSNGKCRTYKYRNSVCSTFFCIHDDGDEGEDFWTKLQAVAGQVETALSQWAMAELGIDPKAYFARYDDLAADVDACSDPATKGWSAKALDILWGQWRGREKEFFLACAALARQHQDRLVEIAKEVELRQPSAFDLALRRTLPPALQEELDMHGVKAGDPVPVYDLWYAFNLASSLHQRKRMQT